MMDKTKRAQLIEDVAKQMSDKRFAHVLRVEQCAITLAQQYHADVEACQYAALLHDYAKEWPYAKYQHYVDTYQLPQTLLAYGSEILHGPVAARVAQYDYHIDNSDILDAIYYHTIGQSNMSLIAKIVFIADYIEDGRTFDGVQTARELAKTDLDEAVRYKLAHTIAHLANMKKVIYPDTLVAYNDWMANK